MINWAELLYIFIYGLSPYYVFFNNGVTHNMPHIKIDPRIILYIKRNKELINNKEFAKILYQAGIDEMHPMSDLIKVLAVVDPDIDEHRFEGCMLYFKDTVTWYREQYTMAPVGEDSGTARLNWLLETCTDYMIKDGDYAKYKQYIIEHSKELVGVTAKPIPKELSWDGSDDYNMGWFNERKFRYHNKEELE